MATLAVSNTSWTSWLCPRDFSAPVTKIVSKGMVLPLVKCAVSVSASVEKVFFEALPETAVSAGIIVVSSIGAYKAARHARIEYEGGEREWKKVIGFGVLSALCGAVALHEVYRVITRVTSGSYSLPQPPLPVPLPPAPLTKVFTHQSLQPPPPPSCEFVYKNATLLTEKPLPLPPAPSLPCKLEFVNTSLLKEEPFTQLGPVFPLRETAAVEVLDKVEETLVEPVVEQVIGLNDSGESLLDQDDLGITPWNPE